MVNNDLSVRFTKLSKFGHGAQLVNIHITHIYFSEVSTLGSTLCHSPPAINAK